MKAIKKEFSTTVKISSDEAQKICRLGKGADCCAFLVLSADGFECLRMDYPANGFIFDRLEKGTMNAKGRGRWTGCYWNGKEK